MAENSQGSVLARARLTVVLSEDRPSAPCSVRAETVSSSAILLAWERPLYNSDKVIAYSVHYMKAEGELSRAAMGVLHHGKRASALGLLGGQENKGGGGGVKRSWGQKPSGSMWDQLWSCFSM